VEEKDSQARRKLAFSIPSLPPSVNSLYWVLYSMRRIELKPEARAWKTRAKEFIPPFKVGENEALSVRITLHGPWLTKEGKFRKADVTNREKLILDAISEKQGWDDSRVVSRTVLKRVSDVERVDVELEVEEDWIHGKDSGGDSAGR
jgi:Holliday junction resolvase RusA-like endonuclease